MQGKGGGHIFFTLASRQGTAWEHVKEGKLGKEGLTPWLCHIQLKCKKAWYVLIHTGFSASPPLQGGVSDNAPSGAYANHSPLQTSTRLLNKRVCTVSAFAGSRSIPLFCVWLWVQLSHTCSCIVCCCLHLKSRLTP